MPQKSPDSYPRYDDSLIAQQTLYEDRQRQLDILYQLTGEVLINEYAPGFLVRLEDVA